MADRNIAMRVKLEAQEYFTGLQKMQAETRKFSDSGDAAFKRKADALDKLGKGALIASGVFTTATVAMIKASADFESKLSQISALGGAYEKNIGRLSGAAFKAGKAFGLSATQVADAQIELAKAGVSVSDILGGALPGALALAAAGQIDVAKATSIASTAMTQFGKSGADVPHIADLLAAGADRSIASVDSLGDSLNQSGLVAAQFGLSVEDTVGTLTSFSKAGLNGSDSGTAFKTMLLSLASPSKEAQKALDEYNITAYDSQGAFVGITSLAGQLQENFKGVAAEQRDAALSTIFGTDAIRAANVLYKQGADVTMGFADAQNVAGAATLAAQKKLDNLNGDLKKLGAALQNDLIGAGSAGQDALRGVTQGATGLLTVFGDLPAPIQGTALAITGVGAAVTAAGAAFLLLTPKIVAAKTAMRDLNISGKGLAVGLAKGAAGTVALTAFGSGLAGLGIQGEATAQQLGFAAKSIDNDFRGLGKLFAVDAKNLSARADQAKRFRELMAENPAGTALNNVANNGVGNNLAKFFTDATAGFLPFADAVRRDEGAFKALGEQLASLAASDYGQFTRSFGQFAQQVGGGRDRMRDFIEVGGPLKDSLVELARSAGLAATDANLLSIATGKGGAASAVREAQAAAQENAEALSVMGGAAVNANGDIQALADTVSGFGSLLLDARSAQRDFEAAVDAASEALESNGRTLDTSTQAGRDNQAALDGIASAAVGAAAALLEQGAGQDEAAGAIRRGRKSFVDAAVQMGLNRTEARKLADQLGLIPSNVTTVIRQSGAAGVLESAEQVDRRLRALDGRSASVAVYYKEYGRDLATGGAKLGAANGGPMPEIGPKGKDSFIIAAARGEHMVTASEVDAVGGHGEMAKVRSAMRAGTLRGYAEGGAIGDAAGSQAAADRRADAAQRQIGRIQERLRAARKAQRDADRAKEAAEEARSNISGKGSEKRKKALEPRVDRLAKLAEQRAKDVEQIEERLDVAREKRDTFRERETAARETAQALRYGREDFVSQQRRGVDDPLTYVDQLRGMSRDDNFSTARQTKYAAAANRYEQSLVDLAKKSEAAAEQLDGLKSSADSMRSGIKSAIVGGYSLNGVPLSGAREASSTTTSRNVQTGWMVRDGIRLKTYKTVEDTKNIAARAGKVTASGIADYYSAGRKDSASFARDLKALGDRGVNGTLLAELAGYGVEQGAPIARALLSGTSGQITAINRNYAEIGANAGKAAGTVTDLNYKALIEDAQNNADKIADRIERDGAKLRKLIASAFGITGYAIGTMNASRGVHLVGEQGPELRWFNGGEAVSTATQTRALMSAAKSRPTPVQVINRMPDTITVQDASGFKATMRVVATQVVNEEAHAVAVQLQG